MTPKISAVICTHNRSDHLVRAMQSLSSQGLKCELFEVLVIDNASSDDTAEIATRFCSEHDHFRYIMEPRLGLSKARNRGLREARGDYVAFLDDDAIAESGWLEAILHAFETVQPKPGCVGGRTVPNWESPRPGWLHDVHMQALSVIDWSDEAFTVEPPKFLVGANIAYDRALVLKLGGFNEALGRIGAILLSGEETELNNRIRAIGRGVFYVPEASVSHFVSQVRLTKAWHMERAKWQGIATGLELLGQGRKPGPSNLVEIAKELFVGNVPRFLCRALISPRPQVRFLFQTLLWMKLNYLCTLLNGGPHLSDS